MISKPDTVDLISPHCPNMSSREGWVINMLTLHFTKGEEVYRGDGKGTAEWVAVTPSAKASAHAFFSRDGTVYEVVPFENRAWHHGESKVNYQGKWYYARTDRCSIGLEIGNCGNMVKGDDGHFYYTFGDNPRRYHPEKFGDPVRATLVFSNGITRTCYWEPYKEPQIQKVTEYSAYVVDKFDIPIQRIVGHEDVATPSGNRKFDPGPIWDWPKFIGDVCDVLGVNVPDDVWRLHKTVK